MDQILCHSFVGLKSNNDDNNDEQREKDVDDLKISYNDNEQLNDHYNCQYGDYRTISIQDCNSPKNIASKCNENKNENNMSMQHEPDDNDDNNNCNTTIMVSHSVSLWDSIHKGDEHNL